MCSAQGGLTMSLVSFTPKTKVKSQVKGADQLQKPQGQGITE